MLGSFAPATRTGPAIYPQRARSGEDAGRLLCGKLVTRADLQAEIAALEARLAWRLITASIAIAGIAVAAIVTLTVATLRVLG